MSTKIEQRIEGLESVLQDVCKQVNALAEEVRQQGERLDAFIREHRADTREIKGLLKTFGARLHSVEGRVGSIEDRLAAVEESVL